MLFLLESGEDWKRDSERDEKPKTADQAEGTGKCLV